jgi:hypothetical protein
MFLHLLNETLYIRIGAVNGFGKSGQSESQTRRRKTSRAAPRRDFCLSFDLKAVSERW